MKIAVLTINKAGESIARKLKADFKNCAVMRLEKDEAKKVEKIFNDYDGLIFVSALGICARLISPFIKNKLMDPAVVCVDTAARFAISLLSGHEGGANALTYLVAGYLGAQPIITTGTEVHKKIILGIGCRRGINADKVKNAILSTLKKTQISLDKIRLIATIDLKKKEAGLIKACSELNLPLVFIPKEDIANFKSVSLSEVVKRYIGLDGVCEPVAILVGKKAKLICQKQAINGVTVAVAKEN
ncbi:MAG: cobalamin biosynthesis protein [Candidatus Omnitrophota bacterium]